MGFGGGDPTIKQLRGGVQCQGKGPPSLSRRGEIISTKMVDNWRKAPILIRWVCLAKKIVPYLNGMAEGRAVK